MPSYKVTLVEDPSWEHVYTFGRPEDFGTYILSSFQGRAIVVTEVEDPLIAFGRARRHDRITSLIRVEDIASTIAAKAAGYATILDQWEGSTDERHKEALHFKGEIAQAILDLDTRWAQIEREPGSY